jgi:hypothetical protein
MITKTLKWGITAALVVSLLSACNSSNDTESQVLQSDSNTELYAYERERTTETQQEFVPKHGRTLVIENIGEGGINDFRTSFIAEINTARSMSSEIARFEQNVADVSDARVALYSNGRIPEIREFYFPTVEIPGHELYVAGVNPRIFFFHYAPLDPNVRRYDTEGNICEIETPIVAIWIPRHCFMPSAEAFKEMTRNFNDLVFIDENMIYSESSSILSLNVLVDNIWLIMTVPAGLYDLDFMRDIALKVIESAELVVV